MTWRLRWVCDQLQRAATAIGQWKTAGEGSGLAEARGGTRAKEPGRQRVTDWPALGLAGAVPLLRAFQVRG